eukprot:1009768-Rhodomonas_salina.7
MSGIAVAHTASGRMVVPGRGTGTRRMAVRCLVLTQGVRWYQATGVLKVDENGIGEVADALEREACNDEEDEEEVWAYCTLLRASSTRAQSMLIHGTDRGYAATRHLVLTARYAATRTGRAGSGS